MKNLILLAALAMSPASAWAKFHFVEMKAVPCYPQSSGQDAQPAADDAVVSEAVRKVFEATGREVPKRSFVQTARGGSWGRYFDGCATCDGGDGSIFAGGDERYRKLRRVMIAGGAKTSTVDLAIQESLRQGVDPYLVLSLIWQESRFKADAKSKAGAIGLMQVMRGTGEEMGVLNAGMLYDEKTNLQAGIKYLRVLASRLRLNADLSDVASMPEHKVKALLASYNAGMGNVMKWIKTQGRELARIPFAETRNYVRVIGSKIASLKA